MLGSFLGYVGRWLDMAICMVLSALILIIIMYPVTALVGTGKFLVDFFRPTPAEKWDGVDRRKRKRGD